MKHPKSKKVMELANFFLLAHEATGGSGKVDMKIPQCHSFEANMCGTPACHAGWYGTFDPDTNYFDDAGDKMGESLGFKNMNELIMWSDDNPDIWGNDAGYKMFSRASAFGKRYMMNPDKLTLKVIGKHWEKVAIRLQELEAAKKGR